MLLRTVVGAVAGAVVGGGFLLSLHQLPLRADITVIAMAIPVIFAFWMFVAGVVITLGFRIGRETRGWWATGIGSGLWVVAIVSISFSGLLGKHSELPISKEALIGLVPCVAFAVAALCTSRRTVAA